MAEHAAEGEIGQWEDWVRDQLKREDSNIKPDVELKLEIINEEK